VRQPKLILYHCRRLSGTTRRRFLGQSRAATAGAWLLPALSGAAESANQPSVKFPSNPRERVAVASYPFREFIAGSDHRERQSNHRTERLRKAHVAEKFSIK